MMAPKLQKKKKRGHQVGGVQPNVCSEQGFDGELDRLKTALLVEFRKHLDAWAEETDPLAIFKANFAVDYYCTRMVALCERGYQTVAQVRGRRVIDPKLGDLERTRVNWKDDGISYDLFKPGALFGDYQKTLEAAVDLLNRIVSDFLAMVKNVMPFKTVAELKYRWEHVINAGTMQGLVASVAAAVAKHTEYYYSGYGMFRLVAMYGLGLPGATSLTVSEKCPCSCICQSLLFLTVLLSCGFPREHLFVALQSFDDGDRASHWGAVCENPASMVRKERESYNLVRARDPATRTTRYSLRSVKAFAKFTVNVVPAYTLVTTTLGEPRGLRVNEFLGVLRDELKDITVGKAKTFERPPSDDIKRASLEWLKGESYREVKMGSYVTKLSRYSDPVVCDYGPDDYAPLEVVGQLSGGYRALFSINYFVHQGNSYVPSNAIIYLFLHDPEDSHKRFVGEVIIRALDDDDDFNIDAYYLDVPDADLLKEAIVELQTCLKSMVGVQEEHHIISHTPWERGDGATVGSYPILFSINEQENERVLGRLDEAMKTGNRVDELYESTKDDVYERAFYQRCRLVAIRKLRAVSKREEEDERREKRGGGGKDLARAVLRLVQRDLER